MRKRTFWFKSNADRFIEKLIWRGIRNIRMYPLQYHPFTWIVQWEEVE